jgi:SAM-dependent methyltransferase
VTSVRTAAAFDAAAPTYDATFSDLLPGQLLREAVWHRLDRAFAPGDVVLDLGCGTGADAAHLGARGVRVVATDISAGMLAQAAERLLVSSTNDLVTLETLDIAQLSPERVARRWPGGFDGAYSSFGALNCVPDRRRVASALAEVVRPGARLVLVVMGPLAPWEIAWHLAHGEPGRAFRRLRSGRTAKVGRGGQLRVWYPGPARLAREFRPWFTVTGSRGVGVALPPSGLSEAMAKRPRLVRMLGAVENRIASLPGAGWLADHYLLELVRE